VSFYSVRFAKCRGTPKSRKNVNLREEDENEDQPAKYDPVDNEGVDTVTHPGRKLSQRGKGNLGPML